MKHRLQFAALCGLITAPVLALEPPVDDAPPPPPLPIAEAEAEAEVQVEAEAKPAAPAAEAPAPPVAIPQVGQPTAYLGIGGEPVPEVLATHLGLGDKAGVVVRLIDPAGPAANAGIAENDIITRVAGKEVGSQEALSAAILEHKPGDEVVIDLIQQGKPTNKSIVLGERQIAPAGPQAMVPGGGLDALDLGAFPEDQAKRIREAIERSLKAMEGIQGEPLLGEIEGGDEMPDIDEAMRDMQRRVAEMLQNAPVQPRAQRMGIQGFMVPGEPGRPAPLGGIDIQRNATLRMMDEDGSIEMKTTDDGTEITRRDRNDNIVWSGPWDTEQDKAAAPADVRERVEQYNFNNGMRLQFRMQNMPRPLEEEPKEQENAPKPAEEPSEEP